VTVVVKLAKYELQSTLASSPCAEPSRVARTCRRQSLALHAVGRGRQPQALLRRDGPAHEVGAKAGRTDVAVTTAVV
jgi:hypothetical protein